MERCRKYAFAARMKVGDELRFRHCRPNIIHAHIVEPEILVFRMEFYSSESYSGNLAYFVGGVGRFRMKRGKRHYRTFINLGFRRVLSPKRVGMSDVVRRCRDRKIDGEANSRIRRVRSTFSYRSVERRRVPEAFREYRYDFRCESIWIKVDVRIDYWEIQMWNIVFHMKYLKFVGIYFTIFKIALATASPI